MKQGPDLRLILAVEAGNLPERFRVSGFFPMDGSTALATLEKAGLWFGPRGSLEERDSFRQVIPYVVLRSGNRVLRYTRTRSGQDARLHGQTSIGLGGHIDLIDAKANDSGIDLLGTVERAADRELAEELGIAAFGKRRWVGLLVDNETAVGRVHVGLVGVWEVPSFPEAATDAAIGEIEPVGLSGLQEAARDLETWSAMILPIVNADMHDVL